MEITIYTDGSSRGNPGPGGWGVVLIIKSNRENTDARVEELGGREAKTTNNRMEMLAMIEGMKTVLAMKNTSGSHVQVCADSEYVIKGATEWMNNWKKNNWKNSQKKPVLNQDLWELIDQTLEECTEKNIVVTWKHVRGHAGVALNERADVIATTFADGEPTKLFKGNREDYTPFLN